MWFNKAMRALESLFVKDKPIIVGVSGGADSLCLLGKLHNAGLSVIVAHFNHKLRSEADADELFVQRIAESLRVEFISSSGDVNTYASAHGYSIEEAARKLRYRFLFEVARDKQAQAVAVGHTADDQVETVLMHFIRGAGLNGLKGMTQQTLLPEFDSQIPVVRPLLDLWRFETENYCRARGWEFRVDASNADETYFRNRLRHRLIPELAAYNSQFRQAVLRMTQSLQADHEALSVFINLLWEESVAETGDGFISFEAAALERAEHGMKRQLLRKAIFQLRPGLRDVDFDLLERAAYGVHQPNKIFDLTGGLYLYREGDLVYVAAYEADLPSAQSPQLTEELDFFIGQSLGLSNGWVLTSELVTDFSLLNSDNWSAYLDADLTGDRLRLCSFRAGDKFEPLGMPGKTVKLQDLFVNLKIAKRMRARWPLVCVDNGIVWAAGLRMAQRYRVTEQTRRVICLQLKRLP
jgi:tRNA(Ile)-lysidine synthase